MTEGTVLGRELVGHNLPFVRDMRSALATIARRTWPRNTSGHMAQAWGLSKAQAANLLKGHAGDGVISTVLRAGGPALAARVMAAMLGEAWHNFLSSEAGRVDDERRRIVEARDALDRRAKYRRAGVGVAERGRP